MSLNTCCFPRIRFPLSHVLHLFSQGTFFFKFLDFFCTVWLLQLCLTGFFYILLIYNSVFSLFLFFCVAPAFDFIFKFLCGFFFFYCTLLLPCSVGCEFGCINFIRSYGRRISFCCLIRMTYFLCRFFLYLTILLDFLLIFCEKTFKFMSSSLNISVM